MGGEEQKLQISDQIGFVKKKAVFWGRDFFSGQEQPYGDVEYWARNGITRLLQYRKAWESVWLQGLFADPVESWNNGYTLFS